MILSLGEWTAIIGILVTSLTVLRTYFKMEGLLNRVDILDKWKQEIKFESRKEMEDRFADRIITELQFKETKESNARLETLVKEIKSDLKESMHALRTDLITLTKNSYKEK